MRRVTAKSKKGKVEVSDNESNHDEQSEQGNGDSGPSDEEAVDEEDAKTNSKRKNKRGKKATDDAPESKKKKQSASSGDEDQDEQEEAEEYEVESIVDMKQNRGKRQFKIRWKGYGADSDTWENEGDLSCPEIIKNFLEKSGDNDNNKTKGKGKKRGNDNNKKPGGNDNNKKPKKKQKTEEGEEGSEEEDNVEYEVEKVMEVHFKKNGSREFLIHWKGFSHKEDTWEPEKNLSCADLIEKFMAEVEKVKKTGPRELRENPHTTARFTLNTARRQSRRNRGKQRTTYHDNE